MYEGSAFGTWGLTVAVFIRGSYMIDTGNMLGKWLLWLNMLVGHKKDKRKWSVFNHAPKQTWALKFLDAVNQRRTNINGY